MTSTSIKRLRRLLHTHKLVPGTKFFDRETMWARCRCGEKLYEIWPEERWDDR
jgi:hypothetical protein